MNIKKFRAISCLFFLLSIAILIVIGLYKRAADNGFDHDAYHDEEVKSYQKFITSTNKTGPHFTELTGISSDRTKLVENIYEYRQQIHPKNSFTRYITTEEETRICEENLKKIIAEVSEVHTSTFGEPSRNNKIMDCSEISDLLSQAPNHRAMTSNITIMFPMATPHSIGMAMLKFTPTNLEIALCSDREIYVWGNSLQVANMTVSPEFYDYLVDIWRANPL